MKLQEIKDAVLAGKTVYWKNSNYKVLNDDNNDWLIVYNHGQSNQNCIGLTWRDGETLNGEEEDFKVEEDEYEMDAQCCPFCGEDVTFVNTARIIDESGESFEVDEYQCVKSGRSFYV